MCKRRVDVEVITLAICIALLPPVWAVIAPYIGISTGAVALICGGVYVANGNKREGAIKISIGFLFGDIWAVLCLKLMNFMVLDENLELFLTLFVFGGVAVIISALLSKWIYCPSWLCGWAIGLTILSTVGANNLGAVPFQIAIAMLIGVWYVGVGVDIVQKLLIRMIKKLKTRKKNCL